MVLSYLCYEIIHRYIHGYHIGCRFMSSIISASNVYDFGMDFDVLVVSLITCGVVALIT
jgi:hypothetical protein